MRPTNPLSAWVETSKPARISKTHRIAVRLSANLESARALQIWRQGMMERHRGLVICYEDLKHKPGEIDLLLGVCWA